MPKLSTALLTEALGVRDEDIVGNLADEVVGVSTDTRADCSGALFVPLVGERFDGHRYIDVARDGGAVATLCQQGQAEAIPEGFAGVLVDDTLVALQQIARRYLETVGSRVVAITGSSGKTTTKEIVAAALNGTAPGGVSSTRGNLNNHIGVPLTVLDIPAQTRFSVVEMGMNHAGEIAELCRIAPPDVALITNIGRAHVGNFIDGIEGVAKAKRELFEGLQPNGIAVVNLDDERVCREPLPSSVVTFGVSEQADIRIVDVTPTSVGQRVEFNVRGVRHVVETKLVGAHNAQNVASAVGIVTALELDVAAALNAVAELAPAPGRLAVTAAGSATTILDDTYNANPDSTRVALQVLADRAPQQQRVVVLGDMLELGDQADAYHEEIGAFAAQLGCRLLAAAGMHVEAIARGAVAAGLDRNSIITAPNSDALAPLVVDRCVADDVILVKGSRGARMETVVNALRSDGGR